MDRFRNGNVTVEIYDHGHGHAKFVTIHRHGRNDRVIGSLSIPASDLDDLMASLTTAVNASAKGGEACKACETRVKRGLEGQCPACANARAKGG